MGGRLVRAILGGSVNPPTSGDGRCSMKMLFSRIYPGASFRFHLLPDTCLEAGARAKPGAFAGKPGDKGGNIQHGWRASHQSLHHAACLFLTRRSSNLRLS